MEIEGSGTCSWLSFVVDKESTPDLYDAVCRAKHLQYPGSRSGSSSLEGFFDRPAQSGHCNVCGHRATLVYECGVVSGRHSMCDKCFGDHLDSMLKQGGGMSNILPCPLCGGEHFSVEIETGKMPSLSDIAKRVNDCVIEAPRLSPLRSHPVFSASPVTSSPLSSRSVPSPSRTRQTVEPSLTSTSSLLFSGSAASRLVPASLHSPSSQSRTKSAMRASSSGSPEKLQSTSGGRKERAAQLHRYPGCE